MNYVFMQVKKGKRWSQLMIMSWIIDTKRDSVNGLFKVIISFFHITSVNYQKFRKTNKWFSRLVAGFGYPCNFSFISYMQLCKEFAKFYWTAFLWMTN